MLTWDEDTLEWVRLGGASVSPDGAGLQVAVEHLSLFAVAAGPPLGSVEIVTPFTPGVSGAVRVSGLTAGANDVLQIEDQANNAVVVRVNPDQDVETLEWALDSGVYTLRYTEHTLSSVQWWTRDIVVGRSLPSGDYATLARTHAPIVQFHGDEEWWPVPVDQTYLERPVDLSLSSPVEGLPDPAVNLTGDDAASALAVLGTNRNVVMSRQVWNAGGSTVWGDTPAPNDDFTIYFSVHDGSGDRLFLTYWFFYLHDPKAPDTSLGAHDRDRESVTIELDTSAGEFDVVSVIYGAHGSGHKMRLADDGDSKWVGDALVLPWDQVDRAEGHPLVYVALGSHAIYPRAGDYQVAVSLFDRWRDEPAGGGATYCPGWEASLCADLGRELGVTVVSSDDDYDLQPFPRPDDVSSDLSADAPDPWRHLTFSGGWVDGLLGFDATFPPFIDRYHSVETWVDGFADSRTNQSTELFDRIGDGLVVERLVEPGPWGALDPLVDADVTIHGGADGAELVMEYQGRVSRDVNGDGFDDVATWGRDGSAAANVVDGLFLGPLSDAGLGDADVQFINSTGAAGGGIVGFLGDLDADGYADVLVGADCGAAEACDVAQHVFFGPLSGALDLASPDARLLSPESDGGLVRGRGVGDLNGDGRDDLAVGAPYGDEDGTDGGVVYLLLSGETAQTGDSWALAGDGRWAAEAQGDYVGWVVAPAGDLDGDGMGEVLVSARGVDTDGDGRDNGAMYLLAGPATGAHTVDDALARITPPTGDWFGWHVSTGLGDVSGDGLADFSVVYAYDDTVADSAGAAYIYFGVPAGDTSTTDADAVVYGDAEDVGIAGAGWTGDINGDGCADLSVVSDQGGPDDEGQAALFYGPISGSRLMSTGDALITSTGSATSCSTCFRAMGVGDTNGDGYDDLAVGFRYDDSYGDNYGAAWFFLGGP